MQLRPVDLGILRDELREFLSHHHGSSLLQSTHSDLLARKAAVLGIPSSEAARWYVSHEAARLGNADLFHVSAPMMAVAWAAAPSLPDFNLLPEDLPVPTGFVYFESAMIEDAVGDIDVKVVAASWGLLGGESAPGGLDCVWIRWYVEMPRRSPLPRAWLCAESLIPFGVGPSVWVDEGGVGPRSVLVLKTVWLLMAQSVGVTESASYDRASIRRFTREHKEPPKVRVITLRRTRGDRDNHGDSRGYHHQWIVRGHWRQQWFPARQVHRPVWIAPHIKGPEGAPLLGGEKVYALRR